MSANDFNKQPTAEKIRRINERKQRYKRSTNNSHKKFINIARRLLFKQCTVRDRELFESKFQAFKNSRAYFFILLAHAKIRLGRVEANQFRRIFGDMVRAKIQFYQKEIDRTDNKNFINFRYDEIADMHFCLKACDLYFEGSVEEAIETIYKKEKITVLKKQQYQIALEVIKDLEKKLRNMEPGALFPYFKDKRLGEEAVDPSVELLEEQFYIEDDSEYRAFFERQHRRKKPKRIKRYKILRNKNATPQSNTPLLFLEDSYPIYPHFFSTIYPYDPVTLAPISQLNPWYNPAPINPSFGESFDLIGNSFIGSMQLTDPIQRYQQYKDIIFNRPVSDIQPIAVPDGKAVIGQAQPFQDARQPNVSVTVLATDAPKPPDLTGTSVNGTNMAQVN